LLKTNGISLATKTLRLEGAQMTFKPLSDKEEFIAAQIVDAAYIVHKNLGPGLLEKVYEVCFCHELAKRGLQFQRQIDFPIVYDGIKFEEGLRLDVLVEDLIICELKAKDEVNPVWRAQVLSHLKLMNKRLGFLINFNVAVFKEGINRIIL
jgi:GxxExxY protein